MSIRIDKSQTGLALVIVLWILTLLTLMAGSFATTMRRETSVSAAIKQNAEALAVAESGIMLAQFMLTQSDPDVRWKGDGSVYRILRADGELRIRILAEGGKVDINTSGNDQLLAVLKSVTKDSWEQQRLLNAILDWRDADDETRQFGAEKKQYQQARLHYGPSNDAFQSLEELQLVLGMNEAVFSAIEPFLTVYSGNNEINQAEASPELLAILQLDLKHRQIADEGLNQRLAEENNDETSSSDENGAFTSDGQTYTIVAQVLREDETGAGLEAVIKLQNDEADQSPFAVFDWKMQTQGMSLFDEARDYPIITIQDEFKYDN